MVTRPKAWVFGCSLAGFGVSNSAGGMDVFLLSVMCCQVEVYATGQSLVQRSPAECACVRVYVCVCVRMCVCVLLSVIKCRNNRLHLLLVGRKRSE